ncbi:MAG: tyrosine-protein phosphatase [Bryobacteraceae bacterium]|jgi:uncharacterized protein (TIGR01244 family)
MRILPGVALLVLAGNAVFSTTIWGADVAVPGVPNFHQVNERVYRGAQPRAEGWSSLAKLGIKTVIDLREEGEHSLQSEQKAVEAAGMHYVNVPLAGLGAPPAEKVSQVLGLLNGNDPVFVHCRRGADRTGTMIACYRIAHDGWSNEKALAEARSHGMAWFEVAMQRYVLAFHATATQSAQVPAEVSAQPASLSSTLN